MSARTAVDCVSHRISVGAVALTMGMVFYLDKILGVGFVAFVLYLIYQQVKHDPQVALQLVMLTIAGIAGLLAILFVVGTAVIRFTSLVEPCEGGGSE